MPKLIKEFDLLKLLHKFINEAKKGKHLQTNGKRIKPASIKNYYYLELLLTKFSAQKKFNIRLKNSSNLTKKQFEDEKKYWKEFYLAFTNYLYDDLKHYDNYVGRNIKLLRSFFNYLINEKGMSIGFFHRKFYAPAEEVDIVVLSTERLNFLFEENDLEKKLNPELKKVKDVFVFGCAVALRFSDLSALKRANVEITNDRIYIKVQSKKTQTFTRVKLTAFAVKIFHRYSKLYTHKILPQFTKAYFNAKIKLVMEHYGFTEPIIRNRQRRGIPEPVYKNQKEKTIYRFCDAVTSHTMRRTAITRFLSNGMTEQTVRQISGHAANSKEFFRYVSLAQTFIDDEIDKMEEKSGKKKLEFDHKM